MSQSTRYLVFLGVISTIAVSFVWLFDWSFFLVLFFPVSIGIAVGASILTRVWTAGMKRPHRAILRSLTYLGASVFGGASLTCFAFWSKSWVYGELPTPRRLDNAIDLSWEVAAIACASTVALAAFAMTQTRNSQADESASGPKQSYRVP